MKNRELIEMLLLVNYGVNIDLSNLKNEKEIKLIEMMLLVNYGVNIDLNL